MWVGGCGGGCMWVITTCVLISRELGSPQISIIKKISNKGQYNPWPLIAGFGKRPFVGVNFLLG